MSDYHSYYKKSKRPYPHQAEFVRQSLGAKRDGKRISVRLPKLLDKYLTKGLSNTIVRLLAEEFSKQRSAFEDYTDEELVESLEGI